ncbi:MAG: YdcF family protein [Bacteroidales bacterium]|nr:YdcF family protein [Bacteroidales bacterium]MBN2748436.1 YdcF family protein [Bacteroidales bacterium]
MAKLLPVVLALTILLILLIDRLVVQSTKVYLYTSVSEVPYSKVGLLLGTSKKLRNGNVNLFYKYRIEAAVELFFAGSIDVILVSGDNGSVQYDEPTDIKNDLMERGVPENKIVLDYAGFNTYDSVVRCKEIFGQASITVISQQFHNERAVYIARRKGMEAFGYNAKDVKQYGGFRTLVREKLARVKMAMDLVISRKPHHMGEKIAIE